MDSSLGVGLNLDSGGSFSDPCGFKILLIWWPFWLVAMATVGRNKKKKIFFCCNVVMYFPFLQKDNSSDLKNESMGESKKKIPGTGLKKNLNTEKVTQPVLG